MYILLWRTLLFFPVPFKIVYTDYDNIMIPYVCLDIQLDGKCNDNAKRMRILSRTNTITLEVKADMMKYFDIACIETDTLVETNHDGMYHVICYPSISNKDNKITFLQVLKLMALVSYIELIII